MPGTAETCRQSPAGGLYLCGLLFKTQCRHSMCLQVVSQAACRWCHRLPGCAGHCNGHDA